MAGPSLIRQLFDSLAPARLALWAAFDSLPRSLPAAGGAPTMRKPEADFFTEAILMKTSETRDLRVLCQKVISHHGP